jgi:hypothetical protein
VWIYTQSNITNIFTWVHNTNTEKIIIMNICLERLESRIDSAIRWLYSRFWHSVACDKIVWSLILAKVFQILQVSISPCSNTRSVQGMGI